MKNNKDLDNANATLAQFSQLSSVQSGYWKSRILMVVLSMEITPFHKCIFIGAKRRYTVASIAPMVQSVRIFFVSPSFLFFT